MVLYSLVFTIALLLAAVQTGFSAVPLDGTEEIEEDIEIEDDPSTKINAPLKPIDIKNPAPSEQETGANTTIASDQQQSLHLPEVQNKLDEKAQRADLFLNFENTSLANVVEEMAKMRNINLLPDKTTNDVKVSLSIRNPLTQEGAWKIFLTLLEVSGYSIVEVDNLYKVMPKDKKLTEALPSYINVPYTTLPDSDMTVRYVMFLQNLTVDSTRDLLKSLLSDKSEAYAYNQANCFIITDRCYHIKAAMKILQELDNMGQAETVVVMKLKQTNASDVKGLLDGLMQRNDGNPLSRLFAKASDTSTEYFPAGTKIIAEDRTNSLVLMGLPAPIKKIEQFIVDYIDVDLKAAESPLHIYELQYTDATQIAEILKDVTAPPDQGPGEQAARYGAIRGGVKYFKSMKFLADKDANRLIVSCTDKQDWEMIKTIIQDLDKPQPQVAIETLIISITATDVDQLGGSLRNPKLNTLGGGIQMQSAQLNVPTLSDPNHPPVTLLGDMFQQLIVSQGSTLLSFGPATNIWAVFETIRTRSNASVLSQPFITVANKATGKIVIGEEQNILLEQGSSGSGYGPVNADTSVQVEPQINLDGVIRMKIDISVSDFLDVSKGQKINRQVNTNVTMADGQVLVLGGFVQTNVSDAVTQTPLLSNIPVLGWFFKNQKRSVDKKYIFIFMAPTIVKPRTSPGAELYTKMKLHGATNYIENGVKTEKSNDPIFNWFFDPQKENYSHKIVDFANARYQPTSVDIKNDPYYRSNVMNEEEAAGSSLIDPLLIKENAPTMLPAPSNTEYQAQAAVQPPAQILIEPRINRGQSHTVNTQELTTPVANMVTPISPTISDAVAKSEILVQDKLAEGIKTKTTQEELALQNPLAALAVAPSSINQYTDDVEKPEIENEVQSEVLNIINAKLQKQKTGTPDTSNLAHQREKLKSLISQMYTPENQLSPRTTNEPSSSDEAKGKEAFKSFLDIPTRTEEPTNQDLATDPTKRNSLKEFLLQSEGATTRKNLS